MKERRQSYQIIKHHEPREVVANLKGSEGQETVNDENIPDGSTGFDGKGKNADEYITKLREESKVAMERKRQDGDDGGGSCGE